MAHEVKLGVLIDETAKRDAIHVAIAPVIAAQILAPGEHVGFIQDDGVTVGRTIEKLGVVDPFLTNVVRPGERFYLFLYPQSITSLRHEWTHPAFAVIEENITNELARLRGMEEQRRLSAREWLAQFAAHNGFVSLEELLEVVSSALPTGVIGGKSRYSAIEFRDDFWDKYEEVTGKKVSKRHEYFRCSC